MKRKGEYINSPEVEARLHSTYVIKIELIECEKYVWRRVRVPSGIDLPKFHDQVIVPVMGWARAYHGYVFEDPVDGTQVGPVKKSGYIGEFISPWFMFKTAIRARCANILTYLHRHDA